MRALLPGLHSMLNLHPLFVHFPIALWLGALVFEIVAVARAKIGIARRRGVFISERSRRCWQC
jgi:uncharacterized membrane protein